MDHKCHAFECSRSVERSLLMCKKHWALVPTDIQVRVKTHFRTEQCTGKVRPSHEWLKAAREAINFITKLEGKWRD